MMSPTISSILKRNETPAKVTYEHTGKCKMYHLSTRIAPAAYPHGAEAGISTRSTKTAQQHFIQACNVDQMHDAHIPSPLGLALSNKWTCNEPAVSL